jgi:aspartate/methionine/tyrosine aminotransferase
MLNNRLDILGDGPFRRLALLIEPMTPAANLPPINLSIGEPQVGCPGLVGDVIEAHRHLYGKYPPPRGTPAYREAVTDWLNWRYDLPTELLDPDRHVVPVSGTKEGMFMLAQVAIPERVGAERPLALLPNPYYHTYAGAVVAAGAEPVFVPAVRETGFLPDFGALEQGVLDRTALCIICSPANPQGAVADTAYLRNLISLARKHDFVLLADECYAEIYSDSPPPGALEVCAADGVLDNVVVFHSLSKRSSAPGLRVGFAAGDPDIVESYMRLRTYGAAVIPLPIDAAATALWRDETHVEKIRTGYRRQFDAAESIVGDRLGFYRPAGGFFLWLEVGDSVAAAEALWRNAAIKLLPGTFLARDVNGDNPGADYIRVPLVHDIETTTEALERIVQTL